MDPVTFTVTNVAAICAATYCFKIVVNAVVRVFEARKLDHADADTHSLAQRIERLEVAIDTVAIELERVGEIQRFSAQLDRGNPSTHLPLSATEVRVQLPEAVAKRELFRAVTPH